MKFSKAHLSFVIAGFATIMLLAVTNLQAVDYASTAEGADVYVLSDTQEMTLGVASEIDILITNDNTPLNAMEAEVYFDPSLFLVTKVTFKDSLCEDRFIIDEEIDNVHGRVHISCGTVTPFTGNATVFGTLTIIPKDTGLGTFSFGAQTNIYVHDGLGTQIAKDRHDMRFNVTEA